MVTDVDHDDIVRCWRGRTMTWWNVDVDVAVVTVAMITVAMIIDAVAMITVAMVTIDASAAEQWRSETLGERGSGGCEQWQHHGPGPLSVTRRLFSYRPSYQTRVL